MKSKISFTKPIGLNGKSLQLRYVALQGVLITFWLLTLVLILILSDVFSILGSYDANRIDSELQRVEAIALEKLNTVALSCNDLCKQVNRSIQSSLEEHSLSATDIQSNPSLLESLLKPEIEKSVFAMEKSNASGVFVILDATVNPALPHAKSSRAGFYIKNTESSPLSYVENVPVLLRGSSMIARKFDMYLDTEWQLEFLLDDDTPYFHHPFKSGMKNSEVNYRHLGYWTPPYFPDINHQKCLAYTIPLIDRSGFVYGVCGVEISEQFLDDYMHLKNASNDDLFGMISYQKHRDDDAHLSKHAIHFGAQANHLTALDYTKLHVIKQNDDLTIYHCTETDSDYIGKALDLNIYSTKSVHHGDTWSLLILRAKAEEASKAGFLIAALCLLFVLSLIIAYVLSKVYTRPISTTFNKIISNDTNIRKTDIEEIDALIDYIKSIDRIDSIQPKNEHDEARLLFTERLESLTKTERSILNHFLKGETTKQICESRFITMSTLKTHSSRIYSKMDVTSRSQLLAYCYNMMSMSIEEKERTS